MDQTHKQTLQQVDRSKVFHSNLDLVAFADRSNLTPFGQALGAGVRLVRACHEEKLIARPLPDGNVSKYSPQLTVDASDVHNIAARTERAVMREVQVIVTEGSWAR